MNAGPTASEKAGRSLDAARLLSVPVDDLEYRLASRTKRIARHLLGLTEPEAIQVLERVGGHFSTDRRD